MYCRWHQLHVHSSDFTPSKTSDFNQSHLLSVILYLVSDSVKDAWIKTLGTGLNIARQTKWKNNEIVHYVFFELHEKRLW